MPLAAIAERDPTPEASASRILIVDDSTVARLYYRQILEFEGHHVEEAINGVEGLEKVSRTPFDLCVVDVNMPIMDGFAFVRSLRRESSTHAIPVLMTTTEAGPLDHQTALQAGTNGFLVKPVPRDQLALYVAALLGKSAP